MNLAPTTRLEAVNVLLASIVEAPVNSLDENGLDEAAIASSVIDETSRAVQTHGWLWNTEYNYPLGRDNTSEIQVPSNTLKIHFKDSRYITRGKRVYDRNTFSYRHSSDLTADIIVGLDWEELPEVLRAYIMYRAGRVFQARQLGSQVLFAFTKEDENAAFLELSSTSMEMENVSIFDNVELQLMLNRDSSVSAFNYRAGSIGGSY
jgi:hypothetical protein|tara:strand:+ start:21911 stop:22528 length:618 start_codon:yes stop_codon:yes gene_type:complete